VLQNGHKFFQKMCDHCHKQQLSLCTQYINYNMNQHFTRSDYIILTTSTYAQQLLFQTDLMGVWHSLDCIIQTTNTFSDYII